MAVQLDLPDRSSDWSEGIDPLTSGTSVKQFNVGAVRTVRVLNYTGNTVFLSFKNVSQLSASWDSVIPAWTERSTSYVGGGQLSVVQIASGYAPGPYDQVLVQASPIPEAPYMAQLPQAVTVSGNVGVTGSVGIAGNVPIANVPVLPYYVTILADAPLLYYRLDEASGTTITDRSGNGRNGVYTANAGLNQSGGTPDGDAAISTTGKAGSYANGTGLPSGHAAFTVEYLIRNPNANTSPIIVSWGTLAAGQVMSSFFSTATNLGLSVFTVGTIQANTPSLVDGAWHHIAMTYDPADVSAGPNGTGRIYVDGQFYGSGTFPSLPNITLSAAGMVLGSWLDGTTEPYAGLLDEVAIYGTALSAARIAAHYQAFRPYLSVFHPQPITIQSAPASVLYSSAQTGTGAGYTALSTVVFASLARPSKLLGAWTQFYYGGAPPPSTYSFGYFELRGVQTNTVLFLAATPARIVNGPVYGQEFYPAPGLDLTSLLPLDTTVKGTAFWQGLSPPANYNQAGGIYYSP